MILDKKTIVKGILTTSAGALLGYAYYYFIGCNAGGSCPITSNPYISTLYGAFMGLILAVPTRKKPVSETNGKENN